MTQDEPLGPDAFEAGIRELGEARYHHRHPFHRLLEAGRLDRTQVRAWVLNRFHYQRVIPRKDAAILARLDDPALRRAWRQRIADHDGALDGSDPGGLERWLVLAEGVGLDRDEVASGRRVLPGVRFAAEAYLHFVQERTILEAVASSLTELFAPGLVAARTAAMLAHYPFVEREALAYFEARLTQAPRDAAFALAYVKEHARTAAAQRAVLDALAFKCDVLWALLDAVHHAYVEPRHRPPGVFEPGLPVVSVLPVPEERS